MRERGSGTRQWLRNLAVAGVGAWLAVSVFSAADSTALSIQRLRLADDAHEEGSTFVAGTLAADVLEEEPRSVRALRLFVCAVWDNRERDLAARTMQAYQSLGAIPEAFDSCATSSPLPSDLLGYHVGLDGSRQIVVLTATADRRGPSTADVLALSQPHMVELGFVCRNLRSEYPRLATEQMRFFIMRWGNPEVSIDLLPETWGCDILHGDSA